jgi:hypothetical protein
MDEGCCLLTRARRESYGAEAVTLHAGQIVEVIGESHRQPALRRVAALTVVTRRWFRICARARR